MQHTDWSRDKAEFVARPADAPHPTDDAERSPLAQQFAELTRRLLQASTVADVLTQVVHATHAVLPDAHMVSVTLRSDDGQLHTPVDTDPVARELDDLQQTYREGACFEASREPGPAYVHSPDLRGESNWPRYGPSAAERGYLSVLSTALLPDVTPPRLSGALNVYSTAAGKLGDDTTRAQTLLLATHAALALAGTRAVQLAELREAHLRRALDTRDMIGQAKGILMQRRGLTAEEAFDLLRRTSQDLNVKLAELANTLATRHTELDLPQR
jgi:hypothetical protein